MRSFIASSLLAFTSLVAFVPQTQAQPRINFETQGCGRFQQQAYYRTAFHDVNLCLGEASLLMVVTDHDGLGRERISVQKQRNADRYEGVSDRGTRYSLDNNALTIGLKGQMPLREKITYTSVKPSESTSVRYDCRSSMKSTPGRSNVSLQIAEQLLLQRDGNVFLYQCVPMAQTIPSASVTGTVTYRQRIALPPNAVVEVALVDVSRQDTAATTIAKQTIATQGKQVPFAFTLPYDPSKIQPNYSYTVQARIIVDGTLQWINTSRYAVITQGNPTQIEVMVQPVK